jgi:hypothetical protein
MMHIWNNGNKANTGRKSQHHPMVESAGGGMAFLPSFLFVALVNIEFGNVKGSAGYLENEWVL